MNREIREKRNELLRKNSKLRGMALDFTGEKSIEIRSKQEEVYNKWNFYNNVIKEMERNNG